ncbi:MAG: class I SAM-dependent methyltransferase, partial [Myxococcota bacterium]
PYNRGTVTTSFRCNICFHTTAPEETEQATVHCNLRRFRDERFAVWRCPRCRSIHARDEVDLDHYYAGYTFHTLELDWRLRAMYRSQLGRLRRAGLHRDHALLDYGCGGGIFLRYLRERGYEAARGFDAYDAHFADRTVLDRTYDVVLAQDVVEHVADPWELLRELDALTKPGGVIAVGTPNADAIDLRRADDFAHTLHEPYHRHIFSRQALLDAGRQMGWQLQRYYATMYINTLVPFVNHRFFMHYLRCFDDTLDLVNEGIRTDSARLFLPDTLFHAFFGYFLAPRTDGMAVFHKPRQLPAAASPEAHRAAQ